jgi:hypothetical protein
MRYRILLPALVLFLAAACASAPDTKVGEGSTTTNLQVSIDQTNEPFLAARQSRLDFRYNIDIRNESSEPVTVERITLSSIGSAAPVQLATRTRGFDRVIAPGATETFDFWTTGLVQDYTSGHRGPLTVRVRPTIRGGDGKGRTETFMRRIEADYTVGFVP